MHDSSTSEIANEAARFARVVLIFVIITASLFVLQCITVFGALHSLWFGALALPVSMLFQLAFLSVFVIATIWLVKYGSLGSLDSEIKRLRMYVVWTLVVWVALAIGFVVLFVAAMRGFMNLL